MNIKVSFYNKDISRVIINDPKTYNSLSTKNLNDLITVFKKLDKNQKIKVIIIAIQVFWSGTSLRKILPNIADNIGAIAIITRVLATLVFWIDIKKVILQIEKLII